MEHPSPTNTQTPKHKERKHQISSIKCLSEFSTTYIPFKSEKNHNPMPNSPLFLNPSISIRRIFDDAYTTIERSPCLSLPL